MRQYRALADDSLVQVRSDRQTTGPFGLFGGGEGARGRCIMNPHVDGGEVVASKFILRMRQGEVFRGEMPGSGGYGDPLERDPDRVLEDLRQGKVTPAHALAVYGVVIDAGSGEVDLAATEARRAEVSQVTS